MTTDSGAKQFVVILGDFTHEGLSTTISSLGFEYFQRKLYGVRPATWMNRASTIAQFRKEGRLAAVVVHLPTPTFLYAAQEEFSKCWQALFEELSKTRAIIFAYEDNLRGEFGIYDADARRHLTADEIRSRLAALPAGEDYERDRLEMTLDLVQNAERSSRQVDSFLSALYASGIEICPFRQRADVTIRLQEFLDEVAGGVFLRIYVPHNRWQSDQLASFLKTFERYLRQIEGRAFSIDTRTTNHGVIYQFRAATGPANLPELDEAIVRFDQFMQLCRDDPKSAAKTLESVGVRSIDAGFVIARYAKEYQRLLLDARQELEQKSLVLRHRFECDLLEGDPGTQDPFRAGAPSVVLSLTGNTGPVHVNIGQLGDNISAETRTEISRIVNGDITYNERDEQLIGLMSKYAERIESVRLRSDLDQLKDASAPEPSRHTAKQRIFAFLLRVGKQAADTATDLGAKALAAYLEQLSKGE